MLLKAHKIKSTKRTAKKQHPVAKKVIKKRQPVSSSIRKLNTTSTDHIPRELLQLQQQQFLTTQHATVMNNLGKHKFPSKFWDNTQADNQANIIDNAFSNGKLLDDDFYAILSQNVKFHHAQVYTPSSIDSQLFLPRHANKLSNPVNLEHVHKVLSVPAELFYDNNTKQFVDEPNINNHLIFDVAWQTQSTQMNIGIDGYTLNLTVTVPEAFHQQLVQRHTENPHNFEQLNEEQLQALILPKPTTDSNTTPTTPFLNTLFAQYDKLNIPHHYQVDKQQTVTYKLISTYGESLRNGQSIQHYEFIPLLLSTLQNYTNPSSSTTADSKHLKNIFAVKNTSYDVLWFLSYALSHPTNSLYDRLMVEMMGQEISKDDWNGWVESM